MSLIGAMMTNTQQWIGSFNKYYAKINLIPIWDAEKHFTFFLLLNERMSLYKRTVKNTEANHKYKLSFDDYNENI